MPIMAKSFAPLQSTREYLPAERFAAYIDRENR